MSKYLVCFVDTLVSLEILSDEPCEILVKLREVLEFISLVGLADSGTKTPASDNALVSRTLAG